MFAIFLTATTKLNEEGFFILLYSVQQGKHNSSRREGIPKEVNRAHFCFVFLVVFSVCLFLFVCFFVAQKSSDFCGTSDQPLEDHEITYAMNDCI